MNPRFAARLRWGAAFGLLLALAIIAKDVALGEWGELNLIKLLTLALTVCLSALIWAWLGRWMGGNGDA